MNFYDKILYIDSDANSKILTYIHDAEEIIEFDIRDDLYRCEDGDCSAICECDKFSCDDNDELRTLSFSVIHNGHTSMFSVTSDDVDMLDNFRDFIDGLEV